MYYPQQQCGSPMDCGGNVYRQTFFMPEPPPEHVMCRKRLPTPPPNIHEQTIVVRPPRQIIHEVIEQPTCPPPIVRKNFVMGNQEPPQYLSSTVCVQPQHFGQAAPPFMGGSIGPQQYIPSYTGTPMQSYPTLGSGAMPYAGGIQQPPFI